MPAGEPAHHGYGGIKLPFRGPVAEKSVKHYVDPRDFSWKEGGRYSSALEGEGG